MKGKPYAGKSVACQFEWNQLGDPECRLFQSRCRAMISKIWPSRGILVASSHAFHGGAAGFSPVNKLQFGSVWVSLGQFGSSDDWILPASSWAFAVGELVFRTVSSS